MRHGLTEGSSFPQAEVSPKIYYMEEEQLCRVHMDQHLTGTRPALKHNDLD